MLRRSSKSVSMLNSRAASLAVRWSIAGRRGAERGYAWAIHAVHGFCGLTRWRNCGSSARYLLCPLAIIRLCHRRAALC